MCSYLVYPSFPLIVCNSGYQSFRCQWIQGLDGCSLSFIQDHYSSHLRGHSYSWRLLSTPGGHSSMSGVVWACSHGGCLLGASLAEVTTWSLLQQKSLTQACSGGGCKNVFPHDTFRGSVPVTLEVPQCSRESLCNTRGCSGLLPWRWFAWGCSCLGCCFGPAPAEI